MALLERSFHLVRGQPQRPDRQSRRPGKNDQASHLDMQNQLLQVKTQVAIAIADQHLLEKKQKKTRTKWPEWMRKAELAVDKNRTIWRAPRCIALKATGS